MTVQTRFNSKTFWVQNFGIYVEPVGDTTWDVITYERSRKGSKIEHRHTEDPAVWAMWERLIAVVSRREEIRREEAETDERFVEPPSG